MILSLGEGKSLLEGTIMKLRKWAPGQKVSKAHVIVDHFHVSQDANQRFDDARKIEQDAGKVEIPRKMFLLAKEKPSQKQRERRSSFPSCFISMIASSQSIRTKQKMGAVPIFLLTNTVRINKIFTLS